MAELYLEWGGDLVLTANGSVQMASGWDETRQFFVRALLTNPAAAAANGYPIPADYIFDPSFGFGAGQDVGTNLQTSTITQKVIQAANNTPNVSPFIPPTVTITQPVAHEFAVVIGLTLSNGAPGTVVLSSG